MRKEYYAELYNYSCSGLVLIPISGDGDGKRPAVKWKQFYTGEKSYDIESLKHLFLIHESAAVLTGAISGNIEIVDIDTKYDITGNLHKLFVRAIKERVPDFFKMNPCVVQTRSGGYHIIYRVSEDYKESNKKLASRPLTEGELLEDPNGRSRVLIETRGNGGYALVPPSVGYHVMQGSFLNLPVISLEQRNLIMEAAMSFNELYELKKDVLPKAENGVSFDWVYASTPWDEFNRNIKCEEILEANGYRIVGKQGNDLLIKHGGNSSSFHSGYVHLESNIFVCFSTSTPFEPGKGYTPFMIYTILKHRGDPKASTKDLFSQGFGSRNNNREQVKPTAPQVNFEEAPAEVETYLPEVVKKKVIGNFTLSDSVQQIINEKTTLDKSAESILGYQLDKERLSALVGFPKDAKDYLDSIRKGTFVMGATTGSTYLDQYFRFKSGLIVMVHGIANVGKSLFTWYLAMLSAAIHGWKWIVYVAENDYEHCVRSLVQFHQGKWVQDISNDDYKRALEFVDRHFVIIKNTSVYSASEVCTLAEYLHFDPNIGPFNAFVIDPYNSLTAETKISDGLKRVQSTKHDLDYEVMSGFRTFCKKTGMALYMNCHTGTEKARMVQQSGKAPNMYDVEGGGKFANRADDFITTHRNTKDPERSMITEMHMDKVKTTETGGRPTAADGPVEFYLWYSKYRFVIMDPSSGYAMDPLETALGRGNGMYPKSLLRANFATVEEPKQIEAEKPKPLLESIPPSTFFDSIDGDQYDF